MNKPLRIAIGIALMAPPSGVFANETITYSYDARGRVIKVEHSGTVNNGVKTEYTLDKAENRTNLTTTGLP
jgi:hypothetical protein